MSITTQPRKLHERAAQLRALDELLHAVTETRSGRLAVVQGEAGIGKTALVRCFTEHVSESARLLWSSCEELFTPRPLGPMFDLAAEIGGRFAEVLERGGTPYEVAHALAETIKAHPPAIVVVEDAHLADEATLDVIRILGSRLPRLPALMVLTFREDAVDRWHPLRIVVGEIGAAFRLDRIRLRALSPATVTALAADQGMSGETLYRKTGGNPFFVTEALAARDADIPDTVREAVLARAARLSPACRRLLDAHAVLGRRAESWLLEALAGDDLESLDEAVASGIVDLTPEGPAFRHELARLAVAEAIPPQRRQSLHRRALGLLADPPDGRADPARLAHHAEAVGDASLVLEHAPPAAARASALGAHREAAAHYRAAVRYADILQPAVRAQLHQALAWESFLTVDFAQAAAAQQEALRAFEELGDRGREGAALTFLSQILWQVGSLPAGLEAAERALERLDDMSPGRERLEACGIMSALKLAAEDTDAARHWAIRAEEEARADDDPAGHSLGLMFVGWVDYFAGRPGGMEKLARALDEARAAGDEATMALCYVVIVRTACRRRDYDVAEPYLRDGLEHCVARDFDVWRYYLLSWRSKVEMGRGHWTEAAQTAQICLGEPCPFGRIHALVALGLVRARRGDPDVWIPLDEAMGLARPRNELQWIAPVAIARAEAAWLERGSAAEVLAETDLAWPDSQGTWYSAALAYWRQRAGVDEEVPDLGEEPYRLELAGDWAGGAEAWRTLGFPYEAAFALIDGDEAAQRRAFDELRALGANPAARIVMQRLRERGARGVLRGPRAETRANPAGLTAREVEVLALVEEGLRNAQIADRLVVSQRTVDHHVSAILRKLGVESRAQAGAAARRLGLQPR